MFFKQPTSQKNLLVLFYYIFLFLHGVKVQTNIKLIFCLILGMGDRNPMHNVPFYNKQSEYVDFSDSTTICKRLSPDFLKETYYVICTKNEACVAAFKMMEMYLKNNNMDPKNIA